MLGYETGSLFAHVADEVHEHMPDGGIVWHHVDQFHPVSAADPLPLVAVALVVLVVAAFGIYRLVATRPTTAMRSTSA